MRPFTTASLALAVPLLLLRVGPARADFLDWSYRLAVSPARVIPGEVGGVAVTLVPGGPGAPDIPLANLSAAFSDSPTAPPDVYQGTPFALTVHLTDNPSQQSGDVTFAGTLSGHVSATASGTDLKATFADPTQKVTVGSHVYTLRIHPALVAVTPPGVPLVSSLVSAQVSVTERITGGGGTPGPGPRQTPEPSALALAGVALSLGAIRWSRRTGRARPALPPSA